MNLQLVSLLNLLLVKDSSRPGSRHKNPAGTHIELACHEDESTKVRSIRSKLFGPMGFSNADDCA